MTFQIVVKSCSQLLFSARASAFCMPLLGNVKKIKESLSIFVWSFHYNWMICQL